MTASNTQDQASTITVIGKPNSTNINPWSIRQIMLRAILAEDAAATVEEKKAVKAECKALVAELFPDHMATKKFIVHFAWHKGQAKKAGLIQVSK